jgi:BirA family transcriptional regulator, biotin operon repressor / biotin---[acetyl-CoA-carboxylase] ligase
LSHEPRATYIDQKPIPPRDQGDPSAGPIHYFERVGSAMDLVHALAEEGADAGTGVLAGEQLEGRGSRGRPWHSPPGGLWASVLLRPAVVGGIEVMSLRVGLAVAAAIETHTGAAIQLKWPNDLMLEHRKLGGILCEARWQGGALGWVAVGIGVNVQNAVPLELQDSAVALGQVRPGITPQDIAQPVVAALRHIDLAAEQLSPAELIEFERRDWLRGRELRGPVHGHAAGLNPDGSLVVRTLHDGVVALRSSSIELAPVPGSR